MYAEMDEKTGDALLISDPIPLPALNVRRGSCQLYLFIHRPSSVQHEIFCSICIDFEIMLDYIIVLFSLR